MHIEKQWQWARGLALALAMTCAGPALAKGDWHALGDFQTGGEAKEVAVNREVSQCAIYVLEGDVIVNTLVVREGGKKTPIPVTVRLAQGQKPYVIPLGAKRLITGFRISDGARGKYCVSVK